MSNGIKTYDPKLYDLILGGHRASGFMDGTFIKMGRTNDTSTEMVGGDGEGARAMSNDKSGILTVTLLQGSATNDFLSALLIKDEKTSDGIVGSSLKDRLGTTLCASRAMWIKKFADVELGKEISGREWTLATTCLNMFVGGTN